MKFTCANAFAGHLTHSTPDHLSQFYALCLPHRFERKRLMEQCAKHFPGAELHRLLLPGNFQELLSTRSLFGEDRLFFIDGLDEIKKEELLHLERLLSELPSSCRAILGSKKMLPLHSSMKKELITLDLSAEKPWDRKKRIVQHLRDLASFEGKLIDAATAAELCELASDDLQGLESELYKCICFIGERKQIDRETISLLVSSHGEINSWQLAEESVWGRSAKLSDFRNLSRDVGRLLPFLSQLRYQLQLGLEMATLYEKGESREELRQQFPKVHPKSWEKYRKRLPELGSGYFSRRLSDLFTLELQIKSRHARAEVFADLFFAKGGVSA